MKLIVVLEKAARVSGFEASTEGNYVRLKWNAVKNSDMAIGYHLIYRSVIQHFVAYYTR